MSAMKPRSEVPDAVSLSSSVSNDPIRARLDALLTRCFYSGSGYVFECDPYAVDEDDDVLKALGTIREADRRHAHLLGSVIQNRGGVPQPGVRHVHLQGEPHHPADQHRQ